MKKDTLVYIDDILESIARIEEYSAGKAEKDFFSDSQLQDSIIRRLEIIGEASKGIPAETKARIPGTPWKQIAGMRDVLIHAYSGVNMGRVWKAVKEDIPSLKEEMLRLKKELRK